MKEAERKKLWDKYMKSKSPDLREQLILEYANVVNLVAGRLNMYLGYTVDYDDLVGYGVFGLIDAIDKYDLTKNVKFETYASLRIRGSILDQIRKMDWIPRTIRQKQKQIDAALREIEAEKGSAATSLEIAEKLGISEEEYIDWQGQMKVTNLVSLNEYLDQGGSELASEKDNSGYFDTPEEAVEQSELKEVLESALELLTEKEKKVILLYYYEDLTLKEISRVLEVSESRVSQLHTRALQKMKEKMGKYMGILEGR